MTAYEDEEDECFCACCGPLIKCTWNNGWRIFLFACAVGVAVILAVCTWLFVLSLRGNPSPERWWVSLVAPVFFAIIACIACMCGGVIWVLLCPARKKKRRARPRSDD